jgi:CelD/BcsL family acetyltransferase involved in cellulose biosynthesis
VDRLLALSRRDLEGVRAFHRRLAPRLAAAGALSLVFLRAGGRDVAVEYGFRSGSSLLAFQSAFVETGDVESPGSALRAILLEEDVFGRGFAEYDLLDGDEPYKRDWASGARRLFDVEVFRPGWPGHARALARGVPALLRDLLRPRPDPEPWG